MTIEDGSGIENANSYVSVLEADEYFSARAISEWEDFDNAAKESAVICATDFVDNSFEWKGKKLTQEQSLRFPRKDLFDYEGAKIEGIPKSLKQAVFESALLIAKNGELFLTANENGNVVSESIGQISFSYSKNDSGLKKTTLYDALNLRLRGLFKEKSKGIICGKILRV